ncbi:hypothetical protein RHHCN13_04505 [Rickettsia conorii subsp. heilongjiangensis]|uniref:Ankyrin repeat protein n=1 Tax=Rickettsia conorii subsp. heilongjiangensis TaxID=226665 RepID=A0AAD1LSP4_RICCR|nr:hypothetical protein [Rickettsia conorii]AEK74881.1 Ankyrin repeat protein [Rickettsia conorii subsp. heilongjiangensis 054]BBM91622.1 hypothetical protein RHCH81_04505 [Rickettsia conorii subsp. heilongjiangensis]BBM92830.1 hypothetical protein RHHCN13_04505 [Rickettsia conorii subsp. heilongjiangensis]BBM94039.1 hypothetical protein RHSENDAI29_04505 [Rickettsia conorii subsp. heilongjiangensis]BBM95248.1 hypothetical protein RHSENDAI58_04505 [Rickettsia conorii subsp. heilongjiangensis]
MDQRKSGGISLHAVAKNVRCTSKDMKDDEIYKLLVSYGADINTTVEFKIAFVGESEVITVMMF